MAKILLVDDEPSILSVLSTLLRAEGYEVTAAAGGVEARQHLANQTFDLMISDIRMSPVNGMELLRQVHDERPAMSVIVLTAYGSVETAIDALKLGAFEAWKSTKRFRSAVCPYLQPSATLNPANNCKAPCRL